MMRPFVFVAVCLAVFSVVCFVPTAFADYAGAVKADPESVKDSFKAPNLSGLMCKNQLSVDWQGYVYDCDFNQMLNMNIENPQTRDRLHIRDIQENDLLNIPVRGADHCYGCTAGQGSSCGGALA